MTYNVAEKFNRAFTLDADFNIAFNGAHISDPIEKGYIYANLFFFDETTKEIAKLQQMIEKIHREVIAELGLPENEPLKLLMEISTRCTRAIGNDGLDAMIKEFLAQTSKHLALIVESSEKYKLAQVYEAIFMELVSAFFVLTLQNATEVEDGVKTFKFTPEYVATLTPRQKNLVAPALRVIGLENKIKLNGLKIAEDWTVKYTPELLETGFAKQEEEIKDQIRNFLKMNAPIE